VNFLGFLQEGDPRHAVFHRQCESAGSTFSFYIKGGEAEAFRSSMHCSDEAGGEPRRHGDAHLASASTTHSGVPKETRDRLGVTDSMVRISVGIEHPDDLIADLEQALG